MNLVCYRLLPDSGDMSLCTILCLLRWCCASNCDDAGCWGVVVLECLYVVVSQLAPSRERTQGRVILTRKFNNTIDTRVTTLTVTTQYEDEY